MDLILLLFFLGVGLYYVLPWIYGRHLKNKIECQTKKDHSIYLTFDDGPGNVMTSRILDILAKDNIKATFFLLGCHIPGREHIVRRIAQEGHSIGFHGFNHLHAWKTWPWNSIRDIREGWKVLDQALGSATQNIYPFRPPYGKMNLISLIYLWHKKLPIILWTVDSQDTGRWYDGTPSYERICRNLSDGGVLLLHDFDRPSSEREQYVLDTLEEIIKSISSERFRFNFLFD